MSQPSTVSARSAMDSGRNWAAIVLFIIWPIAQAFVPRSTPLFLGLTAVILIISKLVANRRGEYEPTFPDGISKHLKNPPTILFFCFLFLMAVSLLWSPMPGRGAKDIAVLLALYFVALFLTQELSRVTLLRFENFVLIALIIGSLGLISETWGLSKLHVTFQETNFVYDLNRNAVWLIVLGCAALALYNRWKEKPALAWAVGFLVCFAVFSSQGESAKFALLLAVPAVLITKFAAPLVRPLFLSFAASLLVMPILAGYLTDSSGQMRLKVPAEANAEHRIALWQGYAELVRHNPVLGWGTKADRVLGGNKMAARIAAERGYPERTTSPHNVALEIWVNHGLTGALLAAAILLAIGWKISEMPVKIRPSIVGMATATFAVAMTGSSFYQGWWIATICTGFVVWNGAVNTMNRGDLKTSEVG